MAIGVPETDVFQAADAVLARGERPTVERVRTQLGRGSPARVGQLLEQWWERLAKRLKGHALLPDLPGEVAQSFAETWRLAVGQADGLARAALAEEQNALFAAQSDLTQERKLWEIALAEAQAQAADSTTRLAQTVAQLGERQALLKQLDAQRTDLLHQRDSLLSQLDQSRTDLERLRAELADAHTHVRTVEDRAHQQVDHARQDLKALQQQLERTQRDHAKAMDQATMQREALQTALRAAEQAAAHQAGRVAALERALQTAHQAPAPSRAKTTKPGAKSAKSPRRAAKKAR